MFMDTYQAGLSEITTAYERWRELMMLNRSTTRWRLVRALAALNAPVNMRALLAVESSLMVCKPILRATAYNTLQGLVKRGLVAYEHNEYALVRGALHRAVEREEKRVKAGRWERRRSKQWRRELPRPLVDTSTLCRHRTPYMSCPSCVAKRRHAIGLEPLKRGDLALKRIHAAHSQICQHTQWVLGCPCCMKRMVWLDEHMGSYTPPPWWSYVGSDRYKARLNALALSQGGPCENERGHE